MVGKDSSGGNLPIPQENIRGFEVVFDAVYNPPETPLLQEAKRYIAVAQSLKKKAWLMLFVWRCSLFLFCALLLIFWLSPCRQGIPIASGLDMFIKQAAAQFRLFSEVEAPISTMTQEVYKALGIQSESFWRCRRRLEEHFCGVGEKRLFVINTEPVALFFFFLIWKKKKRKESADVVHHSTIRHGECCGPQLFTFWLHS